MERSNMFTFPPEGYLTVQQVAERLHTQPNMVYRWIKQKRFIPARVRRYESSPQTAQVIRLSDIEHYEQELASIDQL